VREGTPIEVIKAAVKEIGPDLLLIGTRGRSGLPRVLLGSVAEEVLKSVDVDVLAVPPAR
jgi:nucleotide-binding universal stress UspA family protein